MKRQWQIHRRVIPCPDGQRRWDRAYQLLLQWESQLPPTNHPAQVNQESHHDMASCPLCTGVDPEPNTRTDN